MLRKVPGGLLAIRTGAASGLCVVDIDPRNGGQLDRDLMTPTATVATGGGGWHLYYRHPGGPTLPALPGAAGVDIKGDGGYVAAPPSVHPGTGRPYRWVGGRAVAEMPPALRAALTPPPAAAPAPAVPPLSGPVPARAAGGISSPPALLAALLRAVQEAPEGRRRATLYGAARGRGPDGRRRGPHRAGRPRRPRGGRDRRPANPPRDPRRDRRRIRRRRSRRMTTPTGPAADGAALLAQLHTALTRYVILPSAEAAVAVALWIAATHAQAAWAHAPRLVIRAPEKRCGKSRLLDIVEGTCHAPLITVNASPAAVYRAIGTDTPPTLLVDEADTIFGGKNAEANEDLRGPAERRAPAEPARDPLGHRHPPPGNHPHLRHGRPRRDRRHARHHRRPRRRHPDAPPRPGGDAWPRSGTAATGPPSPPWPPSSRAGSARTCPSSERAEPVMPLEDRAADTWEPLIAVADLAAGEWPELARHAAVVLTADRDQAANVSDRIRLLADCRAAFGDADALPTTTLRHPAAFRPRSALVRPRPGRDHRQAARRACCRVRHPLRQHPVRGADRPGQGLLPGRFHRRMGAVLPRPGGGAVPAVPSRPRPAQTRDGSKPGTARSVPPKQPSQG